MVQLLLTGLQRVHSSVHVSYILVESNTKKQNKQQKKKFRRPNFISSYKTNRRLDTHSNYTKTRPFVFTDAPRTLSTTFSGVRLSTNFFTLFR